MKEKMFNFIQKISNVALLITGSAMLLFTLFLLFSSIFLIVESFLYSIIAMVLSFVAVICSLLIIPATCETITKKYNFNIRWWHKCWIIPIWFFIFVIGFIVIGLVSFTDTIEDTASETSVENATFRPVEASPEDVLGKYAQNITVKTVDAEINTIKNALKYSDGYNEEYLNQSLDYFNSIKKSCSQFTISCKSIKAFYVEENEEFNLACEPCPVPPNYSFVLLNFSLVEEEGNESVYNVTYSMNENVSSTFYKLQKIDAEWKVVNRKMSGKWITETFLAERSKNLTGLKDQIKDIADTAKSLYNELLTLRAIENGVTTTLNTVVGEENVIDVQATQKDDGTYIVSVWYYFSAEFLSDDYLESMDEAAAIYQAIFNSENSITSVQITTIQLYRDEYGNVQQRTLAESSMDKSTAAKVNWDYFESQNLDDITYFEFYQDSLYKSLEDLQEQLERTQEYYNVHQAAYQEYMNSYYSLYS